MAPSNPMNIAELLWTAANEGAQGQAVVDGPIVSTYEVLRARAGAVAAHLADSGLASGDRVAVFLERNADAVACLFGILAAGGIGIVLHDRLRPRQVEHVLRNSGAAILISSAEMLERQPRALDTSARLIDIGDIAREGEGRPAPRAALDPAIIIYTSGSIGLPKGVTLTHGNLTSGVATVASYLGLRSDDRVASLLPLSAVYGLNQLLCSVAVRGTLLIERSPLAHQIVTNLRSQGVTVMAGVPPLWLQLLAVPDFQGQAIPTLRQMQNAGGHLPVDAAKRLRRAQPHADLVLQYGMTETFRGTYLPPAEVDRRPDSMGRAIPGAEILVLREDLTLCEPGEVGELVHCGPTVAAGYWSDPEATARVFRPHPFRTESGERVVFSGDLVRRDAEGFLYFVSRRDRMIKTLSFRIGPDEIGDVLHASGQVTDVVVVGEPDDERGDRIVAHIVLAAGGSLAVLDAFCRAELPRHMQPSRVQIWEHIPRMASGKYDVDALRSRSADGSGNP